MHEGDEPDLLAHLRHPDVLSRKDVAELDLPTFRPQRVTATVWS